jgi:hypothetical protein
MLHLNHGCWLEMIVKQLMVNRVINPPTSIGAFALFSFDPIDFYATGQNQLIQDVIDGFDHFLQHSLLGL